FIPSLVFFLMIRSPPIPQLFPYTTLFRSVEDSRVLLCLRAHRVGPERPGYHHRHGYRSGGRRRSKSDRNCRPGGNECPVPDGDEDRKSTRLNSSHDQISYAVFCLKKKRTI